MATVAELFGWYILRRLIRPVLRGRVQIWSKIGPDPQICPDRKMLKHFCHIHKWRCWNRCLRTWWFCARFESVHWGWTWPGSDLIKLPATIICRNSFIPQIANYTACKEEFLNKEDFFYIEIHSFIYVVGSGPGTGGENSGFLTVVKVTT